MEVQFYWRRDIGVARCEVEMPAETTTDMQYEIDYDNLA